MREAQVKRILHVLGGLNRGGIETWLLQMVNSLDRSRSEIDVLIERISLRPTLRTSWRLGVRTGRIRARRPRHCVARAASLRPAQFMFRKTQTQGSDPRQRQVIWGNRASAHAHGCPYKFTRLC